MRARIISAWVGAAAAVLTVGIVTLSRAQDRQAPAAPDRDDLRAQVARLRAEVEVLQIEHDIDADLLKKLMTDVRTLDAMNGLNLMLKHKMPELRKKFGGNVQAGLPELLTRFGKSVPTAEQLAKEAEDDILQQINLDIWTVEQIRPLLESQRKTFVQRTTELTEKRLRLGDLELSSGVSR